MCDLNLPRTLGRTYIKIDVRWEGNGRVWFFVKVLIQEEKEEKMASGYLKKVYHKRVMRLFQRALTVGECSLYLQLVSSLTTLDSSASLQANLVLLSAVQSFVQVSIAKE